MEQITDLLRERHQIAPGEPDDFAVRDFTEVVKAVQGDGRPGGRACCSAWR